MAGHALTSNATLQCPHGGTVQVVSAATRVRAADGGYLATVADTFSIVGCPFQIPGTPPIPSPCVSVRWVVPDVRARVGGSPTLSRSSVGLCLSAAQVPQGTVVVANTQARVQTQ